MADIRANAREPLEILLDRVRNAAGPDRELDAHIWGLVDSRPLEDDGSGDVIYKRDHVDTIAFDVAPPYTASIDACIALIEEVLPDTESGFGTARVNGLDGGSWTQAYVGFKLVNGDGFVATGKSEISHPALALLRAIMSALVAKSRDAIAREPVGNGGER